MRKKYALAAGLILIIPAVFFLWPSAKIPAPKASDIEKAFRRNNHQQALELAAQIESQQLTPRMLLMLGEAATKLDRKDEAIAFYEQIPLDAVEAVAANWARGDLLRLIGRGRDALEAYQQSVQLEPSNVFGRDGMVQMLNLFGWRHEAAPWLLSLTKDDQLTVDRLLQLGNSTKSIDGGKELALFAQDSHSRSLALAAQARLDLDAGKLVDARKKIEQIDASQMTIEASVQMGRLLLSAPESAANATSFGQWNRSLPANANSHPDIWYLRGRMLVEQGAWTDATGCFTRALLLDSTHLAAHHWLGQALEHENNPLAEPVQGATQQLQSLHLQLELVRQRPQDLAVLRPIVDSTLKLGRFWEARAWAGLALSIDADTDWARQAFANATGQLTRETPQVHPNYNLAAKLKDDIGEWNPAKLDSIPTTPEALTESSSATIMLELAGSASGINESYFAAAEAPFVGRLMHQFTGGGVGVLDFDLDGWPDLFFPQGTSWPDRQQTNPGDALYRNAALRKEGPKWSHVSTPARISEQEYGQGLTVTDYNHDGFPDIYVANIGSNALWLNQGDGTFVRMPAPQTGDESWTVSCAAPDINSDGLPDLFDANYVLGDDVFTRTCTTAGLPRACTPIYFQPSPDRLLVNQGNGIFTSSFNDALDAAAGGNGLGVVSLRSIDGGAQIFVANDQGANHLWTNENSSLLNVGLPSGIAFGVEGSSEACMGIAIGDVDRNGFDDLLVTNFFKENNTLYRQEESGLFIPETGAVGKAGFQQLGFGCQFVDLNRDGWLDAIVLNGHIDDFSHIGSPYKMPAQCFVNVEGRFQNLSSKAGAFFAQRRLGRALAIGDFNRDHLEDAVATDLEAPASILVNRSQPRAGFLTVELIGTESVRDGTGAIVELLDLEQPYVRQIFAGGGYMASNEKKLRFAVPEAKRHRLRVSWPSGAQQTFDDIATNQSIVIIESQAEYFVHEPLVD